MKRTDIEKMLEGVFAPIVTPFKNDEVDYAALKQNLKKYNTTALHGYMPLGSNGEYQGLTDEEGLRILALVQAIKEDDKIIVAGCGRESVNSTVKFIKRATDVGLDLAFVLTPHYFVKYMTEEALYAYYMKIADGSPIPIVIYNAPKFSCDICLSPELIAKLSHHENIIAMKNSSSMRIADYKNIGEDENFCLLAGNIGMFYPGLIEGAVGGVLSTASWLPEYCCRLYDLIKAGSLSSAKKLYDYINRISTCTAGRFGVAGVKFGLDYRGFAGGPVRLPLMDVPETTRQEMSLFLKKEGIPPFPCVPESIAKYE